MNNIIDQHIYELKKIGYVIKAKTIAKMECCCTVECIAIVLGQF